MSHAHHEALRGYNFAQLLVDGCPECEHRGADPSLAINHLDSHQFLIAWARAAYWQQGNLADDAALSAAEVPLLRALWAVQVQLERIGVPIAHLPVGGAAVPVTDLAASLEAHRDAG